MLITSAIRYSRLGLDEFAFRAQPSAGALIALVAQVLLTPFLVTHCYAMCRKSSGGAGGGPSIVRRSLQFSGGAKVGKNLTQGLTFLIV